MKIQYIHKFGIDNFLDNKTSQVEILLKFNKIK